MSEDGDAGTFPVRAATAQIIYLDDYRDRKVVDLRRWLATHRPWQLRRMLAVPRPSEDPA
jgi:hypothetical protein